MHSNRNEISFLNKSSNIVIANWIKYFGFGEALENLNVQNSKNARFVYN